MLWRKRIIWFGVGLLIALILTAWSVFDTINQKIQHQLTEIGKSN